MLSIFSNQKVRNCQGVSRREFLRVGGLGMGAVGMGGLTLANMLGMQSQANASTPSFFRDKSVVMLFLQGGPPQIETFDPKMDQPMEIRSCTGEVKTKLPGITFGGTFPQLAQRADRISIVRTFSSGDGGHNQVPVLSGGSPTQGTMGAHVSRLLGPNHPVTAMPTNAVVLPEAVQPDLKFGTPTGPFSYGYIQKNYTSAGSIGSAYNGMLLDGGGELTENLKLTMPQQRFYDRRYLLSQLDTFKRHFDRSGEMTGMSASQSQAYEVLMRGISDAFDLSDEDPRTVARYDTSHLFRMHDWHQGGKHYRNLRNQSRITNLLGKQMLLARRMCERGCGFVTVVDGCWDFHGDGNNPPTPVGMPLLGPQVDHAVAAFLDDLQERGLSEKIVLVITGEMGRSPKKGGKNGGTGHWAGLTPLLIAGGGLKMGQVIGQTDRSGGDATTTKYLPENLFATVMQTLFDPAEARLVTGLPSEMSRMITTSTPIPELM